MFLSWSLDWLIETSIWTRQPTTCWHFTNEFPSSLFFYQWRLATKLNICREITSRCFHNLPRCQNGKVCSRRGSASCTKTSHLSGTYTTDRPFWHKAIETNHPWQLMILKIQLNNFCANAGEHWGCLTYPSLWLYTVLSSFALPRLALPYLPSLHDIILYLTASCCSEVRRVLRPTWTAWEISALLLLLRPWSRLVVELWMLLVGGCCVSPALLDAETWCFSTVPDRDLP